MLTRRGLLGTLLAAPLVAKARLAEIVQPVACDRWAMYRALYADALCDTILYGELWAVPEPYPLSPLAAVEPE